MSKNTYMSGSGRLLAHVTYYIREFVGLCSALNMHLKNTAPCLTGSFPWQYSGTPLIDNMGPPMAVISIVLHWGCNCTFTEQHVNKILTALHVKLVASTTPHLQVSSK